MLEIKNAVKSFDTVKALDGVDFTVPEGTVFGLVGSNGAGKSTLLRLISGVYEPNEGGAYIDGELTYENTEAKSRLFFIPDFPFYYNASTVDNTAELFRAVYKNWDEEYFQRLCSTFPIDRKQKIINMSKGMQRQASLILGLSTRPSYLLLDEIFDGLDPVVRQLVKRLIIENVADRGTAVVISSHNLRELEDICDHIGLMHRGKIILQRELDELKCDLRKVQIAFTEPTDESVFEGLNIVSLTRQGNLFRVIVRGNAEEIDRKLGALKPAFMESLPLTLEEVFIEEMEAVGYDANKIL